MTQLLSLSMERYKLYVGCEVDKIVVQPCKPFDENVINFLVRCPSL